MKVSVKINNIKNGTVTYSEVSKAGKVMISDTMSAEQFQRAVDSVEFGFKVIAGTKKQTVNAIEFLTGSSVDSFTYEPYLGYPMQCTLNNGSHIEACTKQELIDSVM